MTEQNTARKISKVRMLRATPSRADHRLFLYLEVLEGPYSGNLVTMWVDPENQASDDRLCVLSKIFDTPVAKLLRAARSSNATFFNKLIDSKPRNEFSVVWRFGDTNPRITFVDEVL